MRLVDVLKIVRSQRRTAQSQYDIRASARERVAERTTTCNLKTPRIEIESRTGPGPVDDDRRETRVHRSEDFWRTRVRAGTSPLREWDRATGSTALVSD